ncbi:GGDEF domain-containing protein [Sulfurimonas sp.]|uniref:GGDEF domain-containing protein n=1 Tax=Sulfurimonas sp. TaxID=2022749 RepID=UPI0025FF7013|nr:GGDEF domain-containing protein [Sulfurimonas sp.]MDD5156725.1 GGDEF domain-containing protein [Sulfurimonas sp.]
MQKKDLKALVEEVYESLLVKIDIEKDVSKEQVIGYLRDAIEIISNIDSQKIDSAERVKLAFHNSYKELVEHSLTSYESTNDKFEKLTQLHKVTLEDCIANQIDLPTLEVKFSEIQLHMTNEIKKANDIIYDLSQKVATLEHTSSIDALTKVFNRRELSRSLDEIFSNKDRPYELHLLMLDLDDFKKINDTYGHVAGDKILIFVSNILKKTLRDGDKIFRYGGEEFLIMLNRNSDEGCELMANRLLKLVSSNNLIYMGEKISITASIGMTKLLKDDNKDSLIARVDKAMYISKNSGKNQLTKVME